MTIIFIVWFLFIGFVTAFVYKGIAKKPKGRYFLLILLFWPIILILVFFVSICLLIVESIKMEW